jgi:TPP-dependent pyruvate/acetoin dehydrogenase alpha subunit
VLEVLRQDEDLLRRFYGSLYRIRRVEEEIIRLYPSDAIKSPVHLSIGQESVAVGVCEAMRRGDVAFGTYRGHALYLAKGGSLRAMMAELYGKADGCARGKAGSMHLIDVAAGMMGTSAIVGTTIPQAVGYALFVKMKKQDRVVVCFFGDGATDEGVFHESLNFAALKKLPILFLCENNEYAIYSHIRERMPVDNLCERSRAYRIPAVHIEGGDTNKIYRATVNALTAIRGGDGPQFIEAMTCRWRDHVGPTEDRMYKYRSEEQLDAWIRDDQVKAIGAKIPQSERTEIEDTIDAEIKEAIAFAEVSQFPQPDELYSNIFHV